MHIDLSAQTALVTGATRGIGWGIASVLAASGATVIATGSSNESIAAARTAHPHIRWEAVDLSDSEATERFAERCAGFGLSILVNNAGINVHALVGEVDLAEFDRVQQVNVRAPLQLCRAIVPGMAERGYGRIVNITSILSEVSIARRAPYATSKAALVGLTRTLALDYAARGVLANCVGPGFIDTEMTARMLTPDDRAALIAKVPVGRLGTTDDIATLVTFLASPANSFTTGQNIMADGGFTCT